MTPRQLDLLAAWWQVGTVKGAAARIGVSEQTAKNMLLLARARAGVSSNVELLTLNLDQLRSRYIAP